MIFEKGRHMPTYLLRLAALFTLALFIPGCSGVTRQIGQKIDQMSDAELAVKIHDSSEGAVALAMKLLIDKMPEKKDAILKDAAVASGVIKANILPIFSGASSNDVLAAAITGALQQLSGKISLEVDGAIRLGYGVLASKVTIPNIPTDKLSPRLKGAVTAFFTGSAEALDNLVPAPAIVPVKNP
jgi:Flp pilus assembly pilin Flp